VLVPFQPIPVVPGGDGGSLSVVIEADSLAHAFLVHRSTDAGAVPANGIILMTEGGLILIDTAWTDAQTDAILTWGEQRLKKRWIGAVITHEHADRDGGIEALFRRKIPVAALDLTVAKLARRGIRNVSTLFTARAQAFRDPRGFEAFYPGPGHASDNIVIRTGSMVFGGCLVKSTMAPALGFTADADLPAWPAAVRRVRDRYGNTPIVPGHGPRNADAAATYQHTLDLLKAAGHD